MRTIITVAIGIMIGREIYSQEGQKRIQSKIKSNKTKLKKLLEESGFSKKEIKDAEYEIFN